MTLLEKTYAMGPARPREATPRSSRVDERVGNRRLPPWMPKAGEDIFNFHLKTELGRGAFGCVFLAEQRELAGRPVVLKISEIEGDEPQTLAQLQHTHIVPIHSVHESDSLGLRAVCMPYFGGASLAQILDVLWRKQTPPTSGADFVEALKQTRRADDSNPNLAAPKALEALQVLDYPSACAWIVARLAEGLDHAHQRNVIHCDIKPSNVLIGADGTPMLLDFNVSHKTGTESSDAVLGGTFAYMAPERRSALLTPGASTHNVPTDERCDIYSLGVVLYEMLTGDSLGRPGNLTVPFSPRKLAPRISWSLESICRRCLAPNPAERYQHAHELVEDLRRYLHDEPLKFAPELSARERVGKWLRRHRWFRSTGTVTVVAMILLMAATYYLTSSRRHLESTRDALEVAQAEERRRAYEQGTVLSLCFVNTHADLDSHLAQGQEMCEKTLAIYGVMSRDDWQSDRHWQRLDADSRKKLAEDTRELLLMLSWSKVRKAPRDPATLKSALDLLKRAEAIEGLPDSRALWEDRAKYLEMLEDSAAAQQARTRAAAIPSVTARDCYMLATVHARRGEYATAVAELNKALKINPRHYWALVQRGICYQEMGQVTLAAGDFGACTGLWPEFAFGYFNRGYILEKSGHFDEAIADYTAAIARDPQFGLAYHNRGMARLERKEYAGALADLRRVHELGRDNASLHLGIGVAHEGLKQHDQADAAFARAWAAPPADSDEVQTRRQWVYGFAVADRLPEKAAAAFDAILQKSPRHPQALYGKTVLLINQKQEEPALRLLDQILQNTPNFVAAKRTRAVLLARRGEFAQAARDVNWCLEQQTERGPILYSAACIASLAAEKANDPKAAEHATTQALSFLRQALEHSYARLHFTDDPDLNGIRHHRQFQEWLAQGQR